jgi:hypothetical protein
MRPFDDKAFLGVFEHVKCFGLGVPVNGVEDPVIPTILGHDMILKGQAAAAL